MTRYNFPEISSNLCLASIYCFPYLHSLSGLEGEVVIGLSVLGVDLLEVKGLGEEVVDKGAEGDTVSPTACEILNADALNKGS